MTYLYIQFGFVIGIWTWDIDTDGPLPTTDENSAFVAMPEDEDVQTGWAAVRNEDGTWTFTAPVVIPPTPEEILAANRPQRDNRFNLAVSSAMGHVLMSMDFTGKTDAESIAAKAWQDYYRAVQATDITVLSPAWPDLPSV